MERRLPCTGKHPMRFVILYHETPSGYERSSHWDLMWECEPGGELVTFAIFTEPAVGVAAVAEALPFHRRKYLTYEGEISGQRGRVSRFDEGQVEVVAESTRLIELELAGNRLNCDVELRKDNESWTVRFVK